MLFSNERKRPISELGWAAIGLLLILAGKEIWVCWFAGFDSVAVVETQVVAVEACNLNLGLWELLGFCEREGWANRGLLGSKQVQRVSISKTKEMDNERTTPPSKKKSKGMRRTRTQQPSSTAAREETERRCGEMENIQRYLSKCPQTCSPLLI